MSLSISEQIAYSIIRIETLDANQNVISYGTGFIVEMENQVPGIVTNKHVIEGGTFIKVYFCESDLDGNPIDKANLWMTFEINPFLFNHPDSEVDLCFIAIIATAIEFAKSQGKSLFYRFLELNLLPNDSQISELGIMEDIIMVGYPNALWDSSNNKPIFRKGITATHFKFDYLDKKEFLIDCACFPGSSGSPVFILNEGSFTNKYGGIHVGFSRIYLLGIMSSGPQHLTYPINPLTGQKIEAAIQIPNNLGIVIKSNRILEINEIVQKRLKGE